MRKSGPAYANFFAKKDGPQKIIDGLNKAKSYLPFTELWPGINKTKIAFREKDEDTLVELVVPTLNGIANVIERLRDFLREQYRRDLFPKRYRISDYPGRQLETLLTESLNQFPESKKRLPFQNEPRFKRISDLKILGSNALIALHIIKTAAMITKAPQFEDYYELNLYTQDELLKTAVNWYNKEEDFTILVAGNSAADRLRKGYLSALSLYNLIQLEENPAIQATYKEILSRWWKSYQHENNPLAETISLVSLVDAEDRDPQLIQKNLQEYPLDQSGFGSNYWRLNGRKIGDIHGGGVYKGHSREALPIHERPKDSFLWQRNARRLKGDLENHYPGTDYLFVYWMGQKHDLLPPPLGLQTATKKQLDR